MICPRHRRKFTRLRDQSGPCQHPFHQGEKPKLKKPKKVTTDVANILFQEFGIFGVHLFHPISIPWESDFMHVRQTLIYFSLSKMFYTPFDILTYSYLFLFHFSQSHTQSLLRPKQT